MSWDWKDKAVAGAAVVGVAGALLAFSSWRRAQSAWVAAQGTIAAEAQTIEQAKKQASKIAAEQKARDQATAAQLTAMRKKVEKLKSAAQIASWLPKQLPTPQPVKIEVPKATKANPAPAAVARIPQPDLPALRDYVESCEACSVRLHTAQQDLAAKDEQLKLAGERLSAAEKQRDAALKAAKGGGFWHRVGAAFKWFAIGAGAGAALLCGSGHCK